jgi:hypothetical protein
VPGKKYDSQDEVFTVTSKNEKLTDDIWICNSGAFGRVEILQRLCFMLGRSMRATLWVTENMWQQFQDDNSRLDITLQEVKYVPELRVKLFSIIMSIGNGFNLSNKGLPIVLSTGSVSVTFDRIKKTTNGFVWALFGLCMSPQSPTPQLAVQVREVPSM